MLKVDDLVLEARYPQLQFVVKGPMITDWRDGFPVQRPKHIVIEFDRFLCELNDMAREQEWTDEDKEYVGRAIEAQFSNQFFRDFWIHQPPAVPMPWPTYNETHHNQIPIIASSVGLVAEALRYEQNGRRDGPRESVVKKLQELLGESEPETQGVDVEEDQLAAI